MDYVVLARKYRPQTFAEVAGQEAIARTLTNAIKRQRVAHGFLFAGPSGVGKTTMARILAKGLCCEKGPTPEPCGVCEHCRMIADSTHPDVLEIDAASHGSVDDSRDLVERVTFSPTLARFRVIILDEAHMLSTQAWNALLKVLEEPPPHVHFIFATTETDKVPATIINRCQRYDFRSIDHDRIVERLREVARREGAQAPDAVLDRIARAARGGMRDAQSILDQLLSMSDGAVAMADLDLLLGAARGEDVAAIAGMLLDGSPAQALDRLDPLLSSGVAPTAVLDQLAEHFRLLMLLQTCGATSPAVRRLGAVDDTIKAQAAKAGAEKLLRICQILVGSQQSLRGGVDARLQVELALVRIGRLGDLVDVENLLRRIERVERGGPSPTGPR